MFLMLFTLLATALTALGIYLTTSNKPPVRRRHLLVRLRYAPPVRGLGGALGGPPVRGLGGARLGGPPVRGLGGALGGIFFDQ